MKTLIVYYSLEGNTEWAVRRMAEILDADVQRLVPKKTYPDKGFKKFLWGGKSAVMKETPEIEPLETDAKNYDRIIFASPVWAGTFAPPLRTYLQKTQPEGKQYALVLCSSGGGTQKAADQLGVMLCAAQALPVLSLIDPKSRPDAGNEEKIRAFCHQLQTL